jgi:hypothetical protein
MQPPARPVDAPHAPEVSDEQSEYRSSCPAQEEEEKGRQEKVTPRSRKRVFNSVESHDQHKDWSLAKAKALGLTARKKKIPPAVDLRAPWWNIGNQGFTGSCVGWAFADSLLRYHFVKSGKLKKTEHMSVRYIWMAAKETDKIRTHPTTFIDDAGTCAKSALRVAAKYGALKRTTFPFDGKLVKLKEDDFLKVAARYKIKAYFNLGGAQSGKLDRFREWLAFHGPILTRLKCDSSWNNITRDGLLETYDKKSAHAGHAISIVGYTPTHFIVRNSWGTGWGHKGFAYASYEYAAAAFDEAYGIVI